MVVLGGGHVGVYNVNGNMSYQGHLSHLLRTCHKACNVHACCVSRSGLQEVGADKQAAGFVHKVIKVSLVWLKAIHVIVPWMPGLEDYFYVPFATNSEGHPRS